MKILILTCSTGEGHNSAASALHEYFQAKGIESSVVDTLSLVNTAVSKTASDVYLFSTRTKMFQLLYNAGEAVRTIHAKSPVYLANKLYCGKLLDYINQHGFDTVICVHLFPAEALTALKNAGKLKAVTLFVMTDYTCIPFMEETRLDHYVVPHEHLIEECASKGIPREKLHPLGIPVRQCFYSRSSKAQARNACKRLFGSAVNSEVPWLLVMSGSMGFGNVEALIREIVKEPRAKAIFIVCGTNKRLENDLCKDFGSNENISVIGFTDQIATLMDACDVVFTKPGGLTSTEAAAKNLPIIHTEPIPGCETHNALFFHYHGMSYSTKDVAEQVRRAVSLCTSHQENQRMMEAQRKNINHNTCSDILMLLWKGE